MAGARAKGYPQRVVRSSHALPLASALAIVAGGCGDSLDVSVDYRVVGLARHRQHRRVAAARQHHVAAQRAGLAVGDELLAIDGWRIGSDNDARALLAAAGVGATVEVALFRRGRLVQLRAEVGAGPPPRFELQTRVDAM